MPSWRGYFATWAVLFSAYLLLQQVATFAAH
jgi:hypothetical protein